MTMLIEEHEKIKSFRTNELNRPDGVFKQLETLEKKMNELYRRGDDDNAEMGFHRDHPHSSINIDGAKAAKHLISVMNMLCNWYINSKLTQQEFASCAKYVLNYEKKDEVIIAQILNKNHDKIKNGSEIKSLHSAKHSVHQLRDHRDAFFPILNVFLGIATLGVAHLLYSALKGKFTLFAPSTDSGKKVDKLCKVILANNGGV